MEIEDALRAKPQESAGRAVTPAILRPFDVRESASIVEIAKVIHRTPITVRRLAAREGLGRLINGQWHLSRVAVAMLMDGDRAALAAYHVGERASDLVAPYFARFGIDALSLGRWPMDRENEELAYRVPSFTSDGGGA